MAVGKKSEHKNAARSRFLIKKAFAELLHEKDIAKITVTDIVNRANISRGTFYAHYMDVYDLYAAIQTNIIESVSEEIDRIGIANIITDPTESIHKGMEYLATHKAYFKLYVTSSHSETLVNRVVNLVEERFAQEVGALFSEDDTKKGYLYLVYAAGAIKNFVLHWFNDQIDLSTEECADYICDLYIKNRPDKIKNLASKFSSNTSAQ